MTSEFYKPLYDTESGGTPRAFECRMCSAPRRTTLTLRGMHLHLLRVHKVKYQDELFVMKEERNASAPGPG